MADTKTVHLPNRGPVTVSLDEWDHLVGGIAHDLHSIDTPLRDQQSRQGEPAEFVVDVYRQDGRYLVIGHHFGTLWRVRHETGRLVESHDDAIEAVRAVIDEMAADTELRRELERQILSALLPVPLG